MSRKSDIYVAQPNLSTFAIEAVMASRGPKEIQEHRDRFDTLRNYRDADHKRLLIIGTLDSHMREAVGKVHDGIEVVGLAQNTVSMSSGRVMESWLFQFHPMQWQGAFPSRIKSHSSRSVQPRSSRASSQARVPSVLSCLDDVSNAASFTTFAPC